MAHEISLALESHSLRARELKMLSQLQQTHWWSTLEEDLAGVLERTVEALEADGGAFFIDRIKPMAPQITAKAGLPLGENEGLVRGLIDSTRETGKPLMIKELEPEAGAAVTSLLAIPLQADEQVLGHLALWSVQAGAFGRRHAHLASIVAGQAALLVENQRLSLQVKHQAAYAERARLAREIHDGLAQSLATLKLRTAQMASWWQQGDGPRLAQGLEEVQRLLNEAYVDAREAIDGLHLAAEDAAMEQWMEELALDFETLSGVPVQVRPQATVRLAPDARAQLQRIVQEALSNVRKHARASHVHIAWQEQDGQLLLQIEDDGCGFEPDSVSGARHGLRTMRERAQLLGAMFKVTSQPGKGTSIELRLPLPEKVKHEHTD
jgi:signal transduction histidine kinase